MSSDLTIHPRDFTHVSPLFLMFVLQLKKKITFKTLLPTFHKSLSQICHMSALPPANKHGGVSRKQTRAKEQKKKSYTFQVKRNSVRFYSRSCRSCNAA